VVLISAEMKTMLKNTIKSPYARFLLGSFKDEIWRNLMIMAF